MKLLHFISILLVSFASYGQRIPGEILETVTINLKNAVQVNVDTIIGKITLIPLEFNKEGMISHVDKIKKYKNNIYILDRKQDQILIFDSTGKFLSKIAKAGKGYGEYLMIADFDVHPETGEVYILDRKNNKLIVYNEDKFVKEFKPQFLSKVFAFCFLDNTRILFDNQLSITKNNLKHQLIITDDKLTIIDKQIPYKKSTGLIMSPISPFSVLTGEISYQPVYKDTIFHISKSGMKPKYRLDFGKYWLDEDFLLNDKLDAMTFMRDLNKLDAINFLNTIESDSHVFIYFTFKDKKYAYLYDKSTKKGAFLKDYMENGCGCNGLPIIADGDFFVGVANPHELSNIDLNFLSRQLNVKGIDILDNPLLSFIKFKNIN